MIQRSVPGYTTMIAMTGLLAGRYATDNSNLYDLGCSLGASTLSMRQHLQDINCKLVSVDNSPAMIERCKTVIDRDPGNTTVDLLCANIQDCDIENAAMAVLNFTLQFIEPGQRRELLQKIYSGMNPGGILILSEKVVFENRELNRLNIELHHEFKRANGYSDLEIAQKRNALDNVLVPETLMQHKERLRSVGFSSADVWFQCFNFASLIALK